MSTPAEQATPPSPTFGVAPRFRGVSLDGDDWLSRLADRTNPLVIREIRQGLRTRVFWTSFALMLIAAVVTALIAYGVHSDNPMRGNGQGFFTAFFVILGLVHFLVLPFNTFRSLMREREEETWVLLSLTSLGPRRVLIGKAVSTFIQGILYASALLPFFVFSYFLNGISLPTILFVMFVGLIQHMFLIIVAVCLATLGESRVFRSGAQLLCIGFLFVTFSGGVSATGAAVSFGGNFLDNKEFIAVALGSIWNQLILGYLFIEAASSRLMLSTEDYAKRPRRAWVLALLLAMPGTFLFSLWAGQPFGTNLLFSTFSGSALLAIGAVLIGTDRDGCSRRYRRSGLFRPGALPGFRLAQLVLLAVGAALVTLSMAFGRSEGQALFGFGTGAFYTSLYLSLTVLITRAATSWNLTAPGGQRIFFVILFVVASGLPPLLGLVLRFDVGNAFLHLFNPAVGPFLLADDFDGSSGVQALGLFGILTVPTILLALAADDRLRFHEKRANALMDGRSSAASGIVEATPA